VLDETRSFPPSEEFAKQANAQPSIYAEAEADPLAYWRTQADRLIWTKSPTKTLEWDLPFAKWFSDGTLNASYNCPFHPSRFAGSSSDSPSAPSNAPTSMVDGAISG
jgi:hypothetical protein